MTHDELDALLEKLPGSWPAPEEPEPLVRALETALEAQPGRWDVQKALDAALGAVAADDRLPLVIGSVRRERLIRWDAWTTTWVGADLEVGEPAMVRALRPHTLSQPACARRLVREGRLLAPALRGAVVSGETWPSLVFRLRGTPLGRETEDCDDPILALATSLGTGLQAIEAYERVGLGAPQPGRFELLDGPEGVSLTCLTPHRAGSAAGTIRHLAEHLVGDGDAPLHALIRGLVEVAPDRADEAIVLWRRALTDDLAARWHQLRRRSREFSHVRHVEQLRQAVERLAVLVPPPRGRAALGVDLEGRPTLIEHRDGGLWWGASGELEPVYEAGEVVVRPARRLLRLHSAAPPSARLNRLVDGDPDYAVAACRWLDAALRLRTLRKLLAAA